MKNSAVKHLSNRKEKRNMNKKKNISASLVQLRKINESDLSFLFATANNKIQSSVMNSVFKKTGK